MTSIEKTREAAKATFDQEGANKVKDAKLNQARLAKEAKDREYGTFKDKVSEAREEIEGLKRDLTSVNIDLKKEKDGDKKKMFELKIKGINERIKSISA